MLIELRPTPLATYHRVNRKWIRATWFDKKNKWMNTRVLAAFGSYIGYYVFHTQQQHSLLTTPRWFRSNQKHRDRDWKRTPLLPPTDRRRHTETETPDWTPANTETLCGEENKNHIQFLRTASLCCVLSCWADISVRQKQFKRNSFVSHPRARRRRRCDPHQ